MWSVAHSAWTQVMIQQAKSLLTAMSNLSIELQDYVARELNRVSFGVRRSDHLASHTIRLQQQLCQMIVCKCHDVMIAVATCCCILAPVVPYDLILFTSLLNCCMLSSKYCNAQQHFEIVTIINGLW